MNATNILLLIVGYFVLLFTISYITGKNDSNSIFFNAGKNAPWYIVAFGMVGASLSGVTFISVPGWIETSQFSYLQVVFGYFFGYIIVSQVLLPVYYKLNLTSIYEYLNFRFGTVAHKTGAFYFFISRLLGASFRLFLVAIVLQQFVFDQWNIPFPVTVTISIMLIWIYTYRGGIKTIVWTDTLQTFFMILAVFISIYGILNNLNWTFIDFIKSNEFSNYNTVFFTDNILERHHFLKSFIGGMFVTICMTGLDQDMMQKNLTCKSLKDAQKNMIVFSIVLVAVTYFFMILGSLLYIFKSKNGILMPLMDGQPKTDLLFPEIALNGDLGILLSVTFILGLIAAAYSSADSALTSLTTSFCIDFIDIKNKNASIQKSIRKKIHILMSLTLIFIIIIFKYVLNNNIIDSLLTVASYTYGPLLGLFAFGLYTKFELKERYIYYIVILAPIITYLLSISPILYAYYFDLNVIECNKSGWLCAKSYALSNLYQFGYELLPINGILTFIGLYLIKIRKK